MKQTVLVVALGMTVSATAGLLCAQQSAPAGQSMNMPTPSRNHHPSNGVIDTPGAMPNDMESMEHDEGDTRAQQSSASERNSVQQQATQSGRKPGASSDMQSLTIPIQAMQEPEALEFHTGTDVPAPELLVDIVKREPLTVEHFLELADGSNPTLVQARRNVERSQQQARQAGLPPDPTVGYSGDHIRGGSYHGGEEGAFFSQEFVLGRKLALRRDMYLAEGKANEYALEVQRARVHNDVARAFFDTLAAQQAVIIHERLIQVALDTNINTHELARIGQSDAADILTAEIAVEQERVDFQSAQRNFLAQFAQLATLAGQHSLEVHPLKGSLEEPPQLNPADYVEQAVEQSPLVKRAQANQALGDARLQDAKRERVPNINLTAGEWYSGEALSDGQKAGWMSFAQAGVQVPLWNRNQGNIQAARVLLQRAQDDEVRTRLWTRNQTEPYAQQYQAAHFTADRYRTEMLPRARRAYQLQVMKYQQMSLAYPAVLAAQHMLFTLQLGYTAALNQEWRAAIALQNYGLMNALDEPLSTGSDSTTINLPTAAGIN